MFRSDYALIGHQRLTTHDVHHAGEVVSEANLWKPQPELSEREKVMKSIEEYCIEQRRIEGE